MTYASVAVYSLEGDFLGYGIKDDAAQKLQSTNLYLESEGGKLNEQLERLNTNVDLRSHWPNPKDPAVVQLLSDPDFIPIEYELREVIDDEHSYYVWKQEPAVDENGKYIIDPTTGQPTMVQGSELDELASVIRMKQAWVPKRPTDVMWRIKQASEVIARQRAGIE
jgi:hypothetical protein